MGITVLGAAEALPSRVVPSVEIEDRIRQASGFRLPQGVVERVTGIRTRRMVAEDEYASTLAARAGQAALEAAGVAPSEVDLLVFASASRDFIEPATAHVVTHELGIRAHAFDVTNACNSFINGIEIATTLLASGAYSRALVVTGETPTRSIRWRLESLRQFMTHFAGFTFGDAGGAVVLGEGPGPGLGRPMAETRSEHWDVGGIFGGGSRHPFDFDKLYFTGAGTELRLAFERLGPDVIDALLRRDGHHMQDFRHVFVHQVTVPYTERFCDVVGARHEQLVWTVPELGNIASASLSIQLSRVWESITPGERSLLVGLGGGISIQVMPWERG